MLSPEKCPELVPSLHCLLAATKAHAQTPALKLERMEPVYLDRHAALYNEQERALVATCGSALRTRHLFASFQLEQLWALSESCRWQVLQKLVGKERESTWNDEERLLGMILLDAFLFESRSLIDFFMKYACTVFRVDCPGHMSSDKFRKAMARARSPFSERAQALSAYFDEHVFGDDCWGLLLRGLRDRIAHRDILRGDSTGDEEIMGVRLAWPTVQKMTYERLAQTFDNGVFDLFRDTSPWLFGLKWKTGPYRPELWDEERSAFGSDGSKAGG